MFIVYILAGAMCYYTSIRCFLALRRNSQQATFTMPDNDALMKLLFGARNVPRVNNFIGVFIWLIGGIICTVVLYTEFIIHWNWF